LLKTNTRVIKQVWQIWQSYETCNGLMRAPPGQTKTKNPPTLGEAIRALGGGGVTEACRVSLGVGPKSDQQPWEPRFSFGI